MNEPWAIAIAHEATLDAAAVRRGAHYTAATVAIQLTNLARAGTGRRRSLDPTCGSGIFLLAALETACAAGITPADALDDVFGSDTDAGAVDTARRALAVWAAGHGLRRSTDWLAGRVRVEDGFDALDRVGPSLDMVVGNPPFRSQLRSDTVLDDSERQALRRRFGGQHTRYSDLAVMFLVAAVRAVPRSSRVVLIQPRSVLGAADVSWARDEIDRDHDLTALWFPRRRVFRAAVEVCAPIVTVGHTAQRRVVLHGDVPKRGGSNGSVDDAVNADPGEAMLREVERSSRRGWAELAAAAVGVPPLPEPAVGELLSDVADILSAFRDEYYAVVGNLGEGPRPPGGLGVVTSGVVDVGAHRWDTDSVRLGGRDRLRPWVDPDRVDNQRGATWLRRSAVPKWVVASQSRIIEAAPDPDGSLVGITPTVQVLPHRLNDFDLVGATLSGPTAAALLWQRCGGSGMSGNALRVSAAELARLPIARPAHRGELIAAWRSRRQPGGWQRFVAADRAAWGGRGDDAVGQWWQVASERARRGIPVEANPTAVLP